MTAFDDAFCAAEQEALRFLVEEHGFRVAERQVMRESSQLGVSGRVVYESAPSPRGLVRAAALSIAPLRLELDLHISRAASARYSVEELHELDGKGSFPRRVHGLYDAMLEPEQLLAEFSRLAGVLRSSGARFLDDENGLWEELEEQRLRKAGDEEIRQTLALSKESSRDGDWSRVIDLLSPIEHRLGTTASARLAHARRKRGNGG